MRRSGLRESAPWQTNAAIESSMGRLPIETIRNAVGLNGRNSSAGSQSLRYSAYPESEACIDTGMPAFTHASQNGSNSGRPKRPGAPHSGHRRRPDQNCFGTALKTPLEFLQSAVDDRQCDHRCGEDPILVVELPGFVHPLVERVDDVVDQLGVVLHPLL